MSDLTDWTRSGPGPEGGQESSAEVTSSENQNILKKSHVHQRGIIYDIYNINKVIIKTIYFHI